MKRISKIALTAAVLIAIAYVGATRFNVNPEHTVGEKLDEFNGVVVYYNGAINNTSGRTIASDGYNLGLKFQCVEFVKRYYYERFKHKMPNPMGHAKEFFLPSVPDGGLNKERMLIQYQNNSFNPPVEEDLIVFGPWLLNQYGHVAIISKVGTDFIEVVQQNSGPFGSTRERFPLVLSNGKVRVGNDRVLGWLRREQSNPSFNGTGFQPAR